MLNPKQQLGFWIIYIRWFETKFVPLQPEMWLFVMASLCQVWK